MSVLGDERVGEKVCTAQRGTKGEIKREKLSNLY
jgi:hypothetical protein